MKKHKKITKSLKNKIKKILKILIKNYKSISMMLKYDW